MDIYTIVFAALAVVVCLRLNSVLGQRTGSERPFPVSALDYRLSMIAAILGTVNYVAYQAKCVCTENLIRVPDVMESPKLTE